MVSVSRAISERLFPPYENYIAQRRTSCSWEETEYRAEVVCILLLHVNNDVSPQWFFPSPGAASRQQRSKYLITGWEIPIR